MTESEISLFDERRLLVESKASKERQVLVLQNDIRLLQQQITNLDDRIQALNAQLGIVC